MSNKKCSECGIWFNDSHPSVELCVQCNKMKEHCPDCGEILQPNPGDGNACCHLNYKLNNLTKELQGLFDMIPSKFQVKCREGNGPENLIGSIAISISNMKETYQESDEGSSAVFSLMSKG